MAKLAGGVAQINCGAATETEMKERKDAVRRRQGATQAALEEGIVPGGGLLRLFAARKALDKTRVARRRGQLACNLRNVLDQPLRAIANNAGEDGAVVVSRVFEA